MQVLLFAALLRHLYCVLGTDTGHAGLVGSGTVTIDTMSFSPTNADLVSIGTCSFIGTVSVLSHPTDLDGAGQKHSTVIGGHRFLLFPRRRQRQYSDLILASETCRGAE